MLENIYRDRARKPTDLAVGSSHKAIEKLEVEKNG